MRSLFLKAGSGILGLWLASQFVTGVEFTGTWKILILAGLILGLINVFITPLLKLITLPLRIITLGLFGFIINMAVIKFVDIFFKELAISGLTPLFWTTLILWGLGTILPLLFPKRKQNE
ncbi:MAG: phage holin family protein [Candidatus Nealsonbacteria bacterium]